MPNITKVLSTLTLAIAITRLTKQLLSYLGGGERDLDPLDRDRDLGERDRVRERLLLILSRDLKI